MNVFESNSWNTHIWLTISLRYKFDDKMIGYIVVGIKVWIIVLPSYHSFVLRRGCTSNIIKACLWYTFLLSLHKPTGWICGWHKYYSLLNTETRHTSRHWMNYSANEHLVCFYETNCGYLFLALLSLSYLRFVSNQCKWVVLNEFDKYFASFRHFVWVNYPVTHSVDRSICAPFQKGSCYKLRSLLRFKRSSWDPTAWYSHLRIWLNPLSSNSC